ncbi:MAG: leader peptide processing enzyme [Sphaerochaetaceae bacterium]|jgi:hypothetical protein|nr:leader peptide processing enzyme [Sphaerochaetaceae bacterium]MDX9810082.1 leader peptide processing enzyme [Sphaerochaetaceae bacterium]NLV83129.1 leader peptide processing enzyme [Spirochaetales bacterium]
MNKKVNTAIFILVASIVNIIVMIVLFLLCLVLISRFVNPESSLMPMWFILMFLVSIGGSFLVYSLLIKWITKKYDLEKYLHPIFTPRRKKPFGDGRD